MTDGNGSVKERISADERDISRLQASIDDLYKKNDERSVSNWKAIGVVAGIFGLLIALLLAPIYTALSSHKGDIDTIRAELNTRRHEFPSQEEYKEHTKHIDSFERDFRDLAVRLQATAIMRSEWDTWKAERAKVTEGMREEYKNFFEFVNKRLDALSARINSHEETDVRRDIQKTLETPRK